MMSSGEEAAGGAPVSSAAGAAATLGAVATGCAPVISMTRLIRVKGCPSIVSAALAV
jgi:hypothetical protein